MNSRTLEFDNLSLVPVLYGEHNAHLHHLEKLLGIHIADRGNTLSLSGETTPVSKAETILNRLWDRVLKKEDVSAADIDAMLRFIDNDAMNDSSKDSPYKSSQKHSGDVAIKTKKKSIAPRSPKQAEYLSAIANHDMVFGLGPAGTGKTYLSVAMAVSLFLDGKVERLIFTRPAVEAGENLGFLPGDMKDKVDPYLRPIYDALQDMLPWDFLEKKMETGIIEIAPLAFMRGRTLSNAFVILDEAQNTTTAQMKMFLTRMGESSRMVITGDASQTDLPKHVRSGLQDAIDILHTVSDIAFVQFTNKDVVRHKLVGKILDAYEAHQKS